MSLPAFDLEATAPPQCGLIANLVLCQRPEVCVEAGTYKGHTAYYIGKALEDQPVGHLHTADPYAFGQKATLRGLDRVTFYPVDFLEMLAELPYVDFAYIDASGWDERGAALRWSHFEAVRAKLRPDGIICVDDTDASNWADGEGGRSVERIRPACGVNFRFLRGLSIYHR